MNMFVNKTKPAATIGASPATTTPSTINAQQLMGTPGAGTPAVRLQVLQDIVKADKAVVLPSDFKQLKAALETNDEVRTATALTPAQTAAGMRINRISIKLAGNSHFSGWRDAVGKDTQVVIAKGSAYAGKNIEVNGEIFENASLIYMKKGAGLAQTTYLDLIGKPGEDVTVLAVRVQTVDRRGATVPTKFDVTGNDVTLDGVGGNSIGGDRFWREVKVKIDPNNGPSLARFNHFNSDPYRGHKPGFNETLDLYRTDAQGKLAKDDNGKLISDEHVLNVNGFLGGDADERYHSSVVTPM